MNRNFYYKPLITRQLRTLNQTKSRVLLNKDSKEPLSGQQLIGKSAKQIVVRKAMQSTTKLSKSRYFASNRRFWDLCNPHLIYRKSSLFLRCRNNPNVCLGYITDTKPCFNIRYAISIGSVGSLKLFWPTVSRVAPERVLEDVKRD
jgi:hypothetical protein